MLLMSPANFKSRPTTNLPKFLIGPADRFPSAERNTIHRAQCRSVVKPVRTLRTGQEFGYLNGFKGERVRIGKESVRPLILKIILKPFWCGRTFSFFYRWVPLILPYNSKICSFYYFSAMSSKYSFSWTFDSMSSPGFEDKKTEWRLTIEAIGTNATTFTISQNGKCNLSPSSN